MRLLVCLLTVVGLAGAQEIKLPPGIEKLADKADEVVDVTLDANMLGMAAKFLNEGSHDEATAKKLVSGLKGVYVRSFEFSKEGEYSMADVDSIRAQYQPPVWSRMVGVRSKKSGEHTDVFIKQSNGSIAGLAVIAAEPKELTIVHISGNIDPEQLQQLGGQFGIPKVDIEKKKATPEAKPAAK
jgi:hypothetical protein